ncbi:MAG: OmpA family protein [Chitinophagales bacterium]|nr:OmpA family protein [Chitinophagales bacterium]
MGKNVLVKSCALMILSALVSVSVNAQTIQFASSVKAFSSEAGAKQYSAKQILGKPNVLPQAGDSPCAWMPKDGESAAEFIEIGFDKPMKVQQVAVFENLYPGSIKNIFLIEANGLKHSVYEGTPALINELSRVFRKTVPLTVYEVAAVRIELTPSAVTGNNQLDAVAISDSEIPIEAKINILPDLVFDSQPENLGYSINTEFAEALPVIAPDGKSIYFVRKNSPQNFDISLGENDDIWFSKLDDKGVWTPAVNLGYPLNNEYHNFVCSVTPDGNTLLLGNQYFRDGSTDGGVSISFMGKKGWEFPENLKIKDFKNKDNFMEISMSNDGKALFMTIEMDDAIGGRDIYVSFREDDVNWTKPLNLGATINSAGDEMSPFLASDGKSMYFATTGRSGFGNYDVFVSKRMDSTWTNWSEPVNLGDGLNSPGKDAYYRIPASGDYAYYVSSKNSKGATDIFKIKLPQEVRPDPVTLVYGTVYNKKTNKPVGDTDVIYEILPSGEEAGIASSEPGTGDYKIVLPYGKNYGIRAKAEGYISVSDNLDLTQVAEYKEIRKDLYLAPVEVGEIIRLNNIFFDYDKATLRPESYPELDRVVDFLKTSPKIEIELSGHTDDKGSDNYNLTLSQQRAKAVVDYFIEHGIATSRMIAKGYGETVPVATNETEEGRQLNRRVQFEILKK